MKNLKNPKITMATTLVLITILLLIIFYILMGRYHGIWNPLNYSAIGLNLQEKREINETRHNAKIAELEKLISEVLKVSENYDNLPGLSIEDQNILANKLLAGVRQSPYHPPKHYTIIEGHPFRIFINENLYGDTKLLGVVEIMIEFSGKVQGIIPKENLEKYLKEEKEKSNLERQGAS